MAKLFASSKEEKVAQQIDVQLRSVADSLKRAYEQIRRLVYQNGEFAAQQPGQGPVYDSAAVYAAFAAHTQLQMSAQDLADAARIAKAVLNRSQPGSIVDDVPQATITLPQ